MLTVAADGLPAYTYMTIPRVTSSLKAAGGCSLPKSNAIRRQLGWNPSLAWPLLASARLCSKQVLHRPSIKNPGAAIFFRINGDLEQVRQPTDEELLWILMYADDIALITESVVELTGSLALLDTVFSKRGLTVSTSKTKVLIVGRDAETQAAELTIEGLGDKIEVVPEFK